MMNDMHSDGRSAQQRALDEAWERGVPVEADATDVVFTEAPPAGAVIFQVAPSFVSSKTEIRRPTIGARGTQPIAI